MWVVFISHLPLNFRAYLILQYYFKAIIDLNQYFISHVVQPKFEVRKKYFLIFVILFLTFSFLFQFVYFSGTKHLWWRQEFYQNYQQTPIF